MEVCITGSLNTFMGKPLHRPLMPTLYTGHSIPPLYRPLMPTLYSLGPTCLWGVQSPHPGYPVCNSAVQEAHVTVTVQHAWEGQKPRQAVCCCYQSVILRLPHCCCEGGLKRKGHLPGQAADPLWGGLSLRTVHFNKSGPWAWQSVQVGQPAKRMDVAV